MSEVIYFSQNNETLKHKTIKFTLLFVNVWVAPDYKRNFKNPGGLFTFYPFVYSNCYLTLYVPFHAM